MQYHWVKAALKIPPVEKSFSEILKEKGFQTEKEFHMMVALVDLSTETARFMFKMWQDNDGTKAGLLKLLIPT